MDLKGRAGHRRPLVEGDTLAGVMSMSLELQYM